MNTNEKNGYTEWLEWRAALDYSNKMTGLTDADALDECGSEPTPHFDT